MTTYTFEEIRWPSGARKLKRRICGKRFTRSRTFTQTVNPFNKNTDGRMKSRAEIYAELKVESAAWRPDDRCTNCANDRRNENR